MSNISVLASTHEPNISTTETAETYLVIEVQDEEPTLPLALIIVIVVLVYLTFVLLFLISKSKICHYF